MPTQADIVQRLLAICAAVPDLSAFSECISETLELIPGAYDVPLEDTEQTAVLKAYTGSVVRLGSAMACYPLGYVTEVVFDEDGNLIG